LRADGVRTYEMPDGSKVTVRTVSTSSQSLGAHTTVDVLPIGGRKIEIKFVE